MSPTSPALAGGFFTICPTILILTFSKTHPLSISIWDYSWLHIYFVPVNYPLYKSQDRFFLPHLWPISWVGLEAGGEGDNRGWDGWMASLTRWMWVWVNSGSWWWTGRPGVLRFMGSQRVGHDWATELNWITYHSFHVPKASCMLWSFSTFNLSFPFVVMTLFWNYCQ